MCTTYTILQYSPFPNIEFMWQTNIHTVSHRMFRYSDASISARLNAHRTHTAILISIDQYIIDRLCSRVLPPILQNSCWCPSHTAFLSIKEQYSINTIPADKQSNFVYCYYLYFHQSVHFPRMTITGKSKLEHHTTMPDILYMYYVHINIVLSFHNVVPFIFPYIDDFHSESLSFFQFSAHFVCECMCWHIPRGG